MRSCLKQRTVCVIVRKDGTIHVASNECDVDDLEVCPRVTAGCATGEGYELCGSTHAEANASKKAEATKDVPGTAILFGHNWFCGPCQWALIAVNVQTLIIGDEKYGT